MSVNQKTIKGVLVMGAGILFQQNKRVLLLKRAREGDKWAGYWNCPGGSSEKGESRYETAVRESREEIGPLPIFKVYSHIEHHGYTLFLAEAKYEFTPLLNDEHSEWKWVDQSEVLSYDLHPKDRRGIDFLFRQLIKPPKPFPPERY